MTARSTSGLGSLLIISALVVVALMALIAFMPMWACATCEALLGRPAGVTDVVLDVCTDCGGKDRVTLIKRWRQIRALRSNGVEVPLIP